MQERGEISKSKVEEYEKKTEGDLKKNSKSLKLITLGI